MLQIMKMRVGDNNKTESSDFFYKKSSSQEDFLKEERFYRNLEEKEFPKREAENKSLHKF